MIDTDRYKYSQGYKKYLFRPLIKGYHNVG